VGFGFVAGGGVWEAEAALERMLALQEEGAVVVVDVQVLGDSAPLCRP
jgi:hypothetical protein